MKGPGAKGKGKRSAKRVEDSEGEPKAKKAKTDSSNEEEDDGESHNNSDGETETDFKCSATVKKWNFKISSWNVNGIRAWMKSGSGSYEAKFLGYHSYWAQADKKGYSGVGIYSKTKPLNVSYGIGIAEHDNEGRVITAEYTDFFLVTSCEFLILSCYAFFHILRLILDYRQGWDKDFRKYLKDLDEKKPVILCGDLNVAHKEIDLANPKTNTKTAGFTKEERQGFTELLAEGFVDTYRHFYPNKEKQYSFWSYMRNARAKNVGRLDYFVVSERLIDKVSDSLIRQRVKGSDHCPVVLLLAL
ncbi:DNA-(apurinic or apyrimidinic site) endonuclease [Acropora cervicornis]|uniref:DNA repair nuclease/redox regulator APEX1 n=1 Tax=Acropora cervicornis TaxID=6130 RepID=A0AAD9PWV2_ACRCE|nr:DNA-(apurinic or apyrimidinic site) endonuclease [Acropora cervicornis]